jgi:hypothetical protein
MAPPIFIVAAHRSGTSLMRRILDSHRNIACPPESYWLTHFSAVLDDPLTFDGLWNLGFDRAEALAGLRRVASYFHQCYSQAKGKRRWADKTPQYVQHLDMLYTLFGPDARFVLLYRHPMDVAFSVWRRGWNFVQPSGDRLADSCQYVLQSGLGQWEFGHEHPDACHVIHYDQLVRRPESVLRRLCHQFLHEPWDPSMLAHHRQRHDFGCEDPIVRGTGGFRGSFENWKEWTDAQIHAAETILRPLMDRLGYSLDSPYYHAPEPIDPAQADAS